MRVRGRFCWRPPRSKPDLTLNDISFNAGGPIVKDKLFIYGGYEHLTRGLPSAQHDQSRTMRL